MELLKKKKDIYANNYNIKVKVANITLLKTLNWKKKTWITYPKIELNLND